MTDDERARDILECFDVERWDEDDIEDTVDAIERHLGAVRAEAEAELGAVRAALHEACNIIEGWDARDESAEDVVRFRALAGPREGAR